MGKWNAGSFIVTLNEVKGQKLLCENKAGYSQRFQIPHCVRNDMTEERDNEETLTWNGVRRMWRRVCATMYELILS